MKILDFIEKWPIVLMPFLVLVAIPFTVYSQPQSTTSTASTAAEPEYSASLGLSSSEETAAVGGALEVGIILSTGEAKIDGADAVLRYNPQMLRFAALERGELFEEYVQEEVDETEGCIRLSGLTLDAQPKNGTLGRITFEALKKGTTTVFFEFTPGATKGDSNVALSGAGGVDILKEVQNGIYIIE